MNLQQLCETLHLGQLHKVHAGHRRWTRFHPYLAHLRFLQNQAHEQLRIDTECGTFLIKCYPLDLQAYLNQTGYIQKYANQHNIPTILPIYYNSMSYLIGEEAIYQVFPWIKTASALDTKTISQQNSMWAAETLAKLHQLTWDFADITMPNSIWLPQQEQWQHLLDPINHTSLFLSPSFFSAKKLCDLSTRYVQAFEKLRKEKNAWTWSHGDLIPQNIFVFSSRKIALAERFKLIDWDLAGPMHRDIEYVGLWLNWAHFGKNARRAKLLQKAYTRISGREIHFSQDILDASMGSWLAWLVYLLILAEVGYCPLGMSWSHEMNTVQQALTKLSNH